ncbi:MAG: SBBP repeat-containing protein [Spirochaetes bacterium]|nr:SBBP repeat-containing protein [Spirochaetota bacterium]
MKIRIIITFLFLACAVFSACSDSGSGESPAAAPQSGTLDTSFNNTGFFVYHNLENTSYGYDIAVDENDNIYVTGNIDYENADMALWKITPDGELDQSFAGTGLVTHHNAAGGNYNDYGMSLCIASNGLIYVTGRSYSSIADADDDLAVWSFSDDGLLNDNFSSDGIAIHSNTAGGNGSSSINNDYGTSCVIDGMGRLVISGYSTKSGGDLEMVVWRYGQNGGLDSSFNGTGYIIDEFDMADTNDYGKSIKIDNYGNIVVAGNTNYLFSSTNPVKMFLAKYYSNGYSITDFGTGGAVLEGSPLGDAAGNSVVIDDDNNIIVAGSYDNDPVSNNTDLAVWKYLEDGTPDTAFGTNGAVFYHIDDTQITGNSVCLDEDGRIIVAGYLKGMEYSIAVCRFDGNGALDTSFGNDGIFTHSGAAGSAYAPRYGQAVAIDSIGRILVTGSSEDSNNKMRMTVWCIIP